MKVYFAYPQRGRASDPLCDVLSNATPLSCSFSPLPFEPNWDSRQIDKFLRSAIDEECMSDKVVLGFSRGARALAEPWTKSALARLFFGFPFHYSKEPQRTLGAPLLDSCHSVDIVQGGLDPHGSIASLKDLKLSHTIRMHWIPAANHRFQRKGMPGVAEEQVAAKYKELLAGYQEQLIGSCVEKR